MDSAPPGACSLAALKPASPAWSSQVTEESCAPKLGLSFPTCKRMLEVTKQRKHLPSGSES